MYPIPFSGSQNVHSDIWTSRKTTGCCISPVPVRQKAHSLSYSFKRMCGLSRVKADIIPAPEEHHQVSERGTDVTRKCFWDRHVYFISHVKSVSFICTADGGTVSEIFTSSTRRLVDIRFYRCSERTAGILHGLIFLDVQKFCATLSKPQLI